MALYRASPTGLQTATRTTTQPVSVATRTAYASPARTTFAPSTYASPLRTQVEPRQQSPSRHNVQVAQARNVSPVRRTYAAVPAPAPSFQSVQARAVSPGPRRQAAVVASGVPRAPPSYSSPTGAERMTPPVPPPSGGNVSRLQRVFSEMRDVEQALLQMERDGAILKQRLLASKARALDKYFMVSASTTKQAVMHFWLEWARSERNARFIDGCLQRSLQSDAEFNDRVQSLESEVMQLTEESETVKAEQRQTLDMERAELNAAVTRCEQLEAMVVQMSSVSSRVTDIAQQVRATAPSTTSLPMERPTVAAGIKERLHELLSEIDPRYLGPLQGKTMQELVLEQQMRNDPFEYELRAQFDAVDMNRDGVLDWNNGEIRRFIVNVLTTVNHEPPQWNDWEWYAMFRTFDVDGNHRMDFDECARLAQAIRARARAVQAG